MGLSKHERKKRRELAEMKRQMGLSVPGRKPKEGVERTLGGQISRAKDVGKAMTLVATEARQRVYGLPADLASHEKAGTVLGRLWIRGEITEPMRQAGERYLELYEAAMKAINAPVGLRTKTAGDSGDEVSEDYIEWAIKAVGHYEAIKAFLRSRGVFDAVHGVAVEGHEPCGDNAVRWGLRLLAAKLGIELGRAV